MFMLAFVSMGLFANAYDKSTNSSDIDLTENKAPNKIILFDENDVCVTVTYVCPESPNGSGYGSCTACASSHIYGQNAAAMAELQAASCVGQYAVLCPAP